MAMEKVEYSFPHENEDEKVIEVEPSSAEEIKKAGGHALPVQCDIRFEESIQNAVDQAIEEFGGIDICVNNASAISLTPTLQTDMKRYDLMHNINGLSLIHI